MKGLAARQPQLVAESAVTFGVVPVLSHVLRVTGRHDDASRVIDEEAFVREIMQRSLDLEAGPIRVEALDDQGRVRWTAYYSSYERLLDLVHELFAERAGK